MDARGDELTMAWMTVDDKLHGHRKVVKLGADRAPAIGLWVLCGSWSADHLTDGFVPSYIVEQWDPGLKLAARLVEVKLWREETVDEDDGYQFHDWCEINRSRDQITADRAYNARRTALHRDPKLTSTVRMRDESRCRYCGVQVNWTDRRGSASGTYDHVDPVGPNTLDNVVVSCRGCNSVKAGRTPDQAGMALLEPGSTGPRGPRGGPKIPKPPRSAPVPRSDLDTGQNESQIRSDLPNPPLTLLSTKKTMSDSVGRDRSARDHPDDPPGFRAWYVIYPRHEAVGAARRAYRTARKKTDETTLLAGAEKYRALVMSQRRDPNMIALPASWLNAERWLDETPRQLRSTGLNDF